VAWDINGKHQTILKINYGLFFDRNLLAGAATVPDKGGIFTKSVFDVALPRLGVDYSNTLIDYVIMPKKKSGPNELLALLRAAGGRDVVDSELR